MFILCALGMQGLWVEVTACPECVSGGVGMKCCPVGVCEPLARLCRDPLESIPVIGCAKWDWGLLGTKTALEHRESGDRPPGQLLSATRSREGRLGFSWVGAGREDVQVPSFHWVPLSDTLGEEAIGKDFSL